MITIAPRFMVKNMFSYALKIRQHSTDKVKEVKPGETLPIHELQSGAPPQLSMAFDQPSLKWWVATSERHADARSAPFNLADIGRTNLALQRMTANHGERTYLMRVEAHIQGSSIFVYISRETEPWPLKIRNETSLKLGYQQVVSGGVRELSLNGRTTTHRNFRCVRSDPRAKPTTRGTIPRPGTSACRSHAMAYPYRKTST